MQNSDSGGMTALVAIVAIIVIVGLAYVMLRNVAEPTPDTNGNGGTIELNLGGGTSSTN